MNVNEAIDKLCQEYGSNEVLLALCQALKCDVSPRSMCVVVGQLEIRMKSGPWDTSVVLDGRKVSKVTRLQLDLSSDDRPVVKLEILP